MTDAHKVDFWLSVGSCYSYFPVMRAEDLARKHGVVLRWRPFHVRTIMRDMDNRFLHNKPEKYAYMWHDIARQAALYGIPADVPVPHPIVESELAHRVAILGMQEGWGIDYIHDSFRRWFEYRQEPGSDPNLSDALRELGLDPADIRSRAATCAIGAALDAETAEARDLGIFGAPTFVVNGTELFWGNDRLEHAINWAKYGRIG